MINDLEMKNRTKDNLHAVTTFKIHVKQHVNQYNTSPHDKPVEFNMSTKLISGKFISMSLTTTSITTIYKFHERERRDHPI